jgi:hypothetical protein
MGHRDAALRLVTSAAVAVVLLAAAPEAPAQDIVFRGIAWPRHDKKTGFREWELRARRAEPRSDDRYRCRAPELITYRMVEEDGVKRSRRELFLRSDEGVYLHGVGKSTAELRGHVRAELYAEEKLVIATDAAQVVSSWSKDRSVRRRTITTRSAVSMTSPTRVLTGEEMTIVDESHDREKEKEPERTSWVRIERNVTMVFRGAGTASAFPGGLSPTEAAPGARPADRIRITCLGPFVYDRVRNVAAFHNDVTLSRGSERLTCGKLTLDLGEKKVKDQVRMALSRVLAEGDVRFAGEGQRLRGDRFLWTPERDEGVLEGQPARMTAEGMRGAAARIRMFPKSERIEYDGDAEVEIELGTE